jgi:hypothetical protein
MAEEKLSKRIVSLEGGKAGLSERPVAMVIGAGKAINCRGSAYNLEEATQLFYPFQAVSACLAYFAFFASRTLNFQLLRTHTKTLPCHI